MCLHETQVEAKRVWDFKLKNACIYIGKVHYRYLQTIGVIISQSLGVISLRVVTFYMKKPQNGVKRSLYQNDQSQARIEVVFASLDCIKTLIRD